jgi:hypothetical protein
MGLRRRSYLLEAESAIDAIGSMLFTLKHLEMAVKKVDDKEIADLISNFSSAVDYMLDIVIWRKEHPEASGKLYSASRLVGEFLNDILSWKNKYRVGSV